MVFLQLLVMLLCVQKNFPCRIYELEKIKLVSLLIIIIEKIKIAAIIVFMCVLPRESERELIPLRLCFLYNWKYTHRIVVWDLHNNAYTGCSKSEFVRRIYKTTNFLLIKRFKK